jgi:pimeloyl-ACP methyl ester carboxylesterase
MRADFGFPAAMAQDRIGVKLAMHELLFRAIGAVPALALCVLGLTAAGEVEAAKRSPCVSVANSCTDWVTLGDGPARGMIYRTFPLDVRNPAIRRALIMVHGALRNADHYFATATGAAFLAGALDDSLVIAPAFRSWDGGDCQDKLQPPEVSWSCHGDSWRSGGAATSAPAIASFDFMDEILRRLADRKVFPNLATIVVAGHSAGGQFVSRYEMANRVQNDLGVTVSYVVANPSSYAWPDATRVLPIDDAASANAAEGWKEERPHTKFSYGQFDAATAPKYDQWPYGLGNRLGYTANTSDDQLRRQLASRTATYLFSQVDTLPLGGFDDSPAAMAQGPTRRARGEAFVKYLDEHLGATSSRVMIVPECGHNDRCVFTTDTVLAVLFPAQGK